MLFRDLRKNPQFFREPRERTYHAVGPNAKTAPCGGTRCDRNRPQLHVAPVVTGTDHNGVFVSCNVETLSWLAAPWKLFRAVCGVSNLDLG